ncbi:hypothetical protein GH733_007215, partial [Mirounga leonina]
MLITIGQPGSSEAPASNLLMVVTVVVVAMATAVTVEVMMVAEVRVMLKVMLPVVMVMIVVVMVKVMVVVLMVVEVVLMVMAVEVGVMVVVIIHSKGLHESLWEQEVPGGLDKEENEERVRRASGKEELETETKTEVPQSFSNVLHKAIAVTGLLQKARSRTWDSFTTGGGGFFQFIQSGKSSVLLGTSFRGPLHTLSIGTATNGVSSKTVLSDLILTHETLAEEHKAAGSDTHHTDRESHSSQSIAYEASTFSEHQKSRKRVFTRVSFRS